MVYLILSPYQVLVSKNIHGIPWISMGFSQVLGKPRTLALVALAGAAWLLQASSTVVEPMILSPICANRWDRIK
jgi:hypothetical protein